MLGLADYPSRSGFGFVIPEAVAMRGQPADKQVASVASRDGVALAQDQFSVLSLGLSYY
jgi:hypothetical protein